MVSVSSVSFVNASGFAMDALPRVGPPDRKRSHTAYAIFAAPVERLPGAAAGDRVPAGTVTKILIR